MNERKIIQNELKIESVNKKPESQQSMSTICDTRSFNQKYWQQGPIVTTKGLTYPS